MAICKIELCDKEATTRDGLCKSCYGKIWRKANPQHEKDRARWKETKGPARAAKNAEQRAIREAEKAKVPAAVCSACSDHARKVVSKGLCLLCYQAAYRATKAEEIREKRKEGACMRQLQGLTSALKNG